MWQWNGLIAKIKYPLLQTFIFLYSPVKQWHIQNEDNFNNYFKRATIGKLDSSVGMNNSAFRRDHRPSLIKSKISIKTGQIEISDKIFVRCNWNIIWHELLKNNLSGQVHQGIYSKNISQYSIITKIVILNIWYDIYLKAWDFLCEALSFKQNNIKTSSKFNYWNYILLHIVFTLRD